MAERGDVMLREVLQAINLLREVRPLLDTADAPRAHSTDDCVYLSAPAPLFLPNFGTTPSLWNPVWILNRRGAKSNFNKSMLVHMAAKGENEHACRVETLVGPGAPAGLPRPARIRRIGRCRAAAERIGRGRPRNEREGGFRRKTLAQDLCLQLRCMGREEQNAGTCPSIRFDQCDYQRA